MPCPGPMWPNDWPLANLVKWLSVFFFYQATGDNEEPMEDGGEDAADGSDEDSTREGSTEEDVEMEELGGWFPLACLHRKRRCSEGTENEI